MALKKMSLTVFLAGAAVATIAAAPLAAADPGLYDSYREGDFSYRVPVADGLVQKYRIVAHFTEPVATKAGERSRSVSS